MTQPSTEVESNRLSADMESREPGQLSVYEYRILGPVEIRVAGQPADLGGHRQRTLAALFILRANSVVSTDHLIDLLWGDDPPPSARKTLQAYVSRLRGVLNRDAEVLAGEEPGYVLRADPSTIDAQRFVTAVERARAALPTDPRAAGALLGEALDMWTGQPLADVADEESVRPDAVGLQELRVSALIDRIEADLAIGRHRELIPELEVLVAEHPYRERLWGQIMVALYRSGRQADALRTYQRARSVMIEELGIDPSLELRELEEKILLQEVERVADPAATERGPGSNPYKGLRPFREQDSAEFFGRGATVASLLGRLADMDTSLVAVMGPSGSGKTSLLQAGLIPALRSGAIEGSDEWDIAYMRPGSRPWEELRVAIGTSSPDGSIHSVMASGNTGEPRMDLDEFLRDREAVLLLVIDQFEEVFTRVDDEAAREAFLDSIARTAADTSGRLRVVIGLRADFHARLLEYPDWAGPLADHTEIVVGLTPGELEEAVTGPAGGVDVRVDPALIAELIADVAGHPGSLPLFQYALTEAFATRSADEVTLEDYRSIGGLGGALVGRAEEMYGALSEIQRSALRQLLLRLVSVTEDENAVPRRIPRSEVASLPVDREAMAAAMGALAEHRFVAFDRNPVDGGSTIEIAHEALLREWTRFRRWVAGARSDLRMRRSLVLAAREWEAADRSMDYLVGGNRLDRFESWSENGDLALTYLERDFLDMSRSEVQTEDAIEHRRLVEERRLKRGSSIRLRSLIAALVFGLVGMSFLAYVATERGREAERQAELAAEGAADADRLGKWLWDNSKLMRARETALGSLLLCETDTAVALHLALQSAIWYAEVDSHIPETTVVALHAAMQESHVAYPEGEAAIAVVEVASGLRGIYLHPFEEMFALGIDAVPVPLGPSAHCQEYFGSPWCPRFPSAITLPDGAVAVNPVAALGARPLAGTTVSVEGPPGWEESGVWPGILDRFTEATGIAAVHSSRVGPGATSQAVGSEADVVLSAAPGAVVGVTTPVVGPDGKLVVATIDRPEVRALVEFVAATASVSSP